MTEKNYLEVYPYDKWTGVNIPNFQEGETISDFDLHVHGGRTTAPNLLTEADLINLMDKSGIGAFLFRLTFAN